MEVPVLMGAKYDKWLKAAQSALDESRDAARSAQRLLADKSLFGQAKRTGEAARLMKVSHKAWLTYEKLRHCPPPKNS